MEQIEYNNKTKAQLVTEIKQLEFRYQPRWLYKATKDQLIGLIMCYNKLSEKEVN